MLNNKLFYIALVDNDELKKSDAIILLAGDGFYRIKKTVELYKQKWAPLIVVSGGITDIKYGSYPAQELKVKMVKAGISGSKIILDDKSQNTRQQAENIMELVVKQKWQRIILIASNYHQYRAYLTFIRAMYQSNLMIEMINAPVYLPWFKEEKWGKRIDLLKQEFGKIEKYSINGHIASFEELFNYQIWKEKQNKSK